MLDPKRIPQYYVFASNRIQATGGALPSNYIFLKKEITEANADFSRLSGDNRKYLECNGEDYLLFWFEIPKKIDAEGKATIPVEEVEFQTLIGNDYKISISEVYGNVFASSYGNQSARYFQVVKEAPGNIKDMSNIDWVSFKYGMQTADMIMGLRESSHIKGFSLLAEFN